MNALLKAIQFFDDNKSVWVEATHVQAREGLMVKSLADKQKIRKFVIFSVELALQIGRINEYSKTGITYEAKLFRIAAVSKLPTFLEYTG